MIVVILHIEQNTRINTEDSGRLKIDKRPNTELLTNLCIWVVLERSQHIIT